MVKRILISGAGIAGPALAHALGGRGFDVTVVERAPALRTGGQAVDFRGPVHRAVLERLGLWAPIHEHRTPGTDLVLLGRRAQPVATLPSVMMSGDVEIQRGTLSRLLCERSAPRTTYRFGEWLTGLAPEADGVEVELARGGRERFDLVVGADGLHSGVRALAFGPEADFPIHQGYRVATFSFPDGLGLRGRALSYAVPGRALTLGGEGQGERARAVFVFAGGPLGPARSNRERQVQLLRETYGDVGWEAPRVLAELTQADDLYLDDIATIALPRYARGRTVLLGDAAWGGTLGGQGTSLAVVGAYVLARELVSTPEDPMGAFDRYEARLRPYARACQKGAERVGPFFAPRTRLGLVARDLLYRALTSRPLLGQFEKLVKASASAFELPAEA